MASEKFYRLVERMRARGTNAVHDWSADKCRQAGEQDRLAQLSPLLWAFGRIHHGLSAYRGHDAIRPTGEARSVERLLVFREVRTQ